MVASLSLVFAVFWMAALKVSRRGAKIRKECGEAGFFVFPFFFFFFANLCAFASLRESSRLAVETWTEVHVSEVGGPFSTG
jgi:hypothetical protein